MSFSISQESYAVRDASEIAFGVLMLGLFLAPVALGLGFVAVIAIGALTETNLPTEYAASLSVAVWIGAMALIVRRYRRVAASWGEERRGKGMFHLLEWLTLAANLFLSAMDRNNDAVLFFRIFLGGLMLLMLVSHALTYALLGYRPKKGEILVWAALVTALLVELLR